MMCFRCFPLGSSPPTPYNNTWRMNCLADANHPRFPTPPYEDDKVGQTKHIVRSPSFASRNLQAAETCCECASCSLVPFGQVVFLTDW